MSFETKYRTRPGSSSSIREHHRLRRAVSVKTFEKSKISNRRHFFGVASQIARIDHPSIPFLIDITEDATGCHLLFDSVSPGAPSDDAGDHASVRTMSQIGAIVDALCAAAGHNIFHGNLTPDQLTGDAIIVTGLGEIQLTNASADKTKLAKLDFEFVRQAATDIASTATGVDYRWSELHESLLGVTKLTDMRDILQHWLDYVTTRLQKEQFTFDDTQRAVPREDNADEGVHTTPQWIVATAAAAAIVVATCVYIGWPRAQHDTLATHAPSPSPAVTPEAPTTSPLATVGTLNKTDNPSVSTSLTNHDIEPVAKVPTLDEREETDEPIEKTEEPSEITVETESLSIAQEKKSLEETQTIEESPTRNVNPFANAPLTHRLPDLDDTSPLTLWHSETPLDKPLAMRLLGGRGTGKQTAFSIREIDAGSTWEISLTERKATKKIGEVRVGPKGGTFRWLPESATLPRSVFLCNAAFEFRADSYHHRFALREPIVRGALRLNPESSRPLDLKIPNAPDEQLYFQFAGSETGNSVASPTLIPWQEQSMKIGLDDGKASLFVMQVQGEPRARLKTSTVMRVPVEGNHRPSRKSPHRPIKNGFGTTLVKQYQAGVIQLRAAQTAMQYIQGEDAKERREAAQTAIRVLEQQLEGMKQVREAYQFARNARLYAIIYRQVEDMQIVLVSFGKATNLE